MLNDKSRERNTHSALFRTTHAIDERWSFTALFSWVKQEEVIKPLTGKTHITSTTGISDIIALTQYKLVSKTNANLIFAAGAKFPVGSTNHSDPETGLTLNPDLQPGTGAWDAILGARYLYSGILRPTSVFSVHTIYRLTFADNRYEGRQVYEFGNEWQVLIGFGDSFFNQWLSPSLTIRYRQTQPDKADHIPRINTGGHWLHLVPELKVNFSANTSGILSGEIPFYRNLSGFQLTTTYRINVAVLYSFTT